MAAVAAVAVVAAAVAQPDEINQNLIIKINFCWEIALHKINTVAVARLYEYIYSIRMTKYKYLVVVLLLLPIKQRLLYLLLLLSKLLFLLQNTKQN